jgi:diacylglycerol kinase family enzyme
MNTLDKLRCFGVSLANIIGKSSVAPGKNLRWIIIANPGAGGFTIGRRWKKHEEVLRKSLEKIAQSSIQRKASPAACCLNGENAELGKYGLIPTNGPGHAMTITKKLLEETNQNSDFYLIATAGGDGTSLEVLQILCQAPASFRARCAILRLPMGTGNDGADAWELADALKLLTEVSRIELTRGLKLSTATGKTWQNGEPLRAFNILSVGLDAFVTHMTNKMKGSLPGDSYKLWVDIASLLYDKLYKVGPMEVKGFDSKGADKQSFREKVLLCAMGASGRRSYGSHKMILPDERNVCIMKQMPLFRKIALKGLFYTGTHIDKPEAILFSAHRISVSGEYPILAQMDGETILLTKEDFPAVIELTEPIIPVLRV